MAPKCTPDIGNHPVFNNQNSLSGVPYSLKIFKCLFTAAHHQANDLLQTEVLEKEHEERPTENVSLTF